MSQKINETEMRIDDAYGVSLDYIDSIGEQLATICALAQKGKEPAGFLAKKIQETFSKDDLEIIATMFMIKVINQESEKEMKECDCLSCKEKRGEDIKDSDISSALQNFLSKEFPGIEAMVVKVPKEPKGKTNC